MFALAFFTPCVWWVPSEPHPPVPHLHCGIASDSLQFGGAGEVHSLGRVTFASAEPPEWAQDPVRNAECSWKAFCPNVLWGRVEIEAHPALIALPRDQKHFILHYCYLGVGRESWGGGRVVTWWGLGGWVLGMHLLPLRLPLGILNGLPQR